MHFQPGFGLDITCHPVDLMFLFGRQNEPHVQPVGAFIIMRHFGMRVDFGQDCIELILRHRHGAEAKGTAHCFGIKERAETGDCALFAQMFQARDQFAFGQAKRPAGLGKRARGQGKLALFVTFGLCMVLSLWFALWGKRHDNSPELSYLGILLIIVVTLVTLASAIAQRGAGNAEESYRKQQSEALFRSVNAIDDVKRP